MIGVCMKYAQRNQGGVLQAQALCCEFEKRNLDYELIRYVKKDSLGKKITSLPRLLNVVLLSDKIHRVRKNVAAVFSPEFKQLNNLRKQTYKKYTDEKFTRLSPKYVGFDALCQGSRNYDAVVVGSDQLWSPSGLPTNFYNLMFVHDTIRKISIASSFGVKNIPWYQRKRTAEYLRRLDFISVRERRGAEIVKELTGRDALVAADPVLLLSREEWEDLIPVERQYEEPYMFAYFLGTNPEHRRTAKQFAKEKGLKLVAFRHVDQYVPCDRNFGDIAPFDKTPAEFLNIIRHAEYVFTDSYHGALFSMLHRKKFVIFDRYPENIAFSKNSRIDTLCANFGVGACRYKGNLDENVNAAIDYDDVQLRIDEIADRTRQYLDVAFEGVQ